MTRHELRRRMATLKLLSRERRRQALRALPQSAVRAIAQEWWWGVHGGQDEPEGNWRIWAIVAGRGFGKTRAGAEWVAQRAREHPEARIALVAASLDEVAKVMVEGESGLLAIARCDEKPRWLSSRGIFLFPSGAAAFAYTAERPGKLRGPQHHFAWCDELAKWPPSTGSGQSKADATWDNLMMGLRLGEAPRTIVTTTPQPVPLLKRILALKRCEPTYGRTDQNPHSAADFREAMTEMYAGTRLGRQELDGILFDDPEGALWTREMLEGARAENGDSIYFPLSRSGKCILSPLRRIVIGVDPPVSTTGDACGIVVCGLGADPSPGSGQGGIAYVLADLTVSGLRPEGWARKVAAAAEAWDAQLIVAEKNQGGDMIESVLRGVDSALPVRLVSATKGKAARAEPVALRFETGRAKLAGSFPELEDELCAMTYGGYEGPGSPDRADAMVWAMAELIKPPREPKVRGF
ncbi:MAG TPA: terminase family protein [Allosphingosinicella sp.]|nr:terminase family protein [Allosphingosinicella sp.]